MAEDHDLEHFQDAYRDATAFLEAVRAGDAEGVRVVQEHTVCVPCLYESVSKIASKLWTRAAVEEAAGVAVADLAKLIEDD